MMVKFTKEEMKKLLISIIFVSILSSIHFIYKFKFPIDKYIPVILISIIIFAFSFFLRTYNQKNISRKLGFHIQYTYWGYGFLFSIFTMLLSIMIITPGYYKDKLYNKMATDSQKAKISLYGPITNLILSIIFMIIIIIISGTTNLGLNDINSYLLLASIIGFNINSYLAFFNSIPFMVLDGINILNWNYKYWIMLIIPSAILSIVSFTNILLI